MNHLRRIIKLCAKHPFLTIFAFLAGSFSMSASILFPKLLGLTIDTATASIQIGSIFNQGMILLTSAIFINMLLLGLFTLGKSYFSESLAENVSYDLRKKFFNHVINLKFAFHDKTHTGNLMSRAITDMNSVRSLISSGIMDTPFQIGLLIIVPILLINSHLQLGLLSLIISIAIVTIAIPLRLKVRSLWLKIQKNLASLSTTLQEDLTGITIVKSFGAENYEMNKFQSSNKDIASQIISAELIRSRYVALKLFAFLLLTGIVLIAGRNLVITEQLSTGELAQFLFYLVMLQSPVIAIGGKIAVFVRGIEASKRILDIIDADWKIKEPLVPAIIKNVKGNIQFNDVTFSYNEITTLQSIKLDIEHGMSVGLIGMPGSGKSTLFKLIPRFYDIDSGILSLDGNDIRTLPLEDLRNNIGIVPQDVLLFPITIRENIAYNKPTADFNEIIRVARIADIHSFIETLPNGYDTIVSERGANLSGGQKQRIAIARALITDPPILLLDDPTASVDFTTEMRINKALEIVTQDRTTLIATNRVSSLIKTDLIVVMENGKIVNKGTHYNLLETSPIYQELYYIQTEQKVS